MNALRKIHRALIPGGLLMDMHPIPPSARAEIGGKSLGEFDDAEFMKIVSATEAPLADGSLFELETEVEFDWLQRYGSAEELIEDASSWEGCSMPAALQARVREAEPPLDIWEHVVLRRFRAVQTEHDPVPGTGTCPI